MDDIEVEIAQDVYDAATIEARQTGRTIDGQINHWIRIGLEVDTEWHRAAEQR